ncbi:Uncharacterised protein [Yersinia similis]|nr:Uncharacterised protein [Yersinia similis]
MLPIETNKLFNSTLHLELFSAGNLTLELSGTGRLPFCQDSCHPHKNH